MQTKQNISYYALVGMIEPPKKMIENNQREKVDKIVDVVCSFYGVERSEVVSDSRRRNLCLCRHVITHLIRERTKMGFKDIGRLLGGRDHTTSINSIRALRGWLETDFYLAQQINLIKRLLDA